MKQAVLALAVALSSLLSVKVAQGQEAAPPEGPDGRESPSWIQPAVEAPRLEYRTFLSEAAGGMVSYQVYKPYVYDSDAERRFPVLYWLHGSGGGRAGLKPISRIFGEAMLRGRIPPMLVVFPNGLANGMWCDSKDGRTPVESVFINELIPEVDGKFRTVASKAGRVIEGFSMGGYGAARLGFKHHDLFCAVSILGAGPMQKDLSYTPRVGPKNREKILEEVYGADQEYFYAQSPWFLAGEKKDAIAGKLRIRQAVGSLDETLPANRDFHARLEELFIDHAFLVFDGVKHDPQALIKAMGEENWKFYRTALGGGKKD